MNEVDQCQWGNFVKSNNPELDSCCEYCPKEHKKTCPTAPPAKSKKKLINLNHSKHV